MPQHKTVVDIAKGEPDFHTPDHIKRAAQAAIDENFTKYTPQPGIPELREAIAKKFVTENAIDAAARQIVVSCGGKHAVDNAVRCLIRPGDEVIMTLPYWFAYPEQVALCGGRPVFVITRPQNAYVPAVEDVRAALTTKTRLIIINTPNNPTGAVYPRETLLELGRIAVERDVMIIADEVYEKIVFDGACHVSLASLGKDVAERTITVNSVSKTHAMTGWRIGYAAYPGDLADRVSKIQSVSTSAPSAVSQRAAVTALTGDQSHVAAMTRAYDERRQLVTARLARMSLMSFVAPAGTFYCFVDLGRITGRSINGVVIDDANAFAAALREHAGVNVLSGAAFGASHHIRISFAVDLDALQEGLDRMEQFLATAFKE